MSMTGSLTMERFGFVKSTVRVTTRWLLPLSLAYLVASLPSRQTQRVIEEIGCAVADGMRVAAQSLSEPVPYSLPPLWRVYADMFLQWLDRER